MKCEEAQKYLTALPGTSDWTREIEEAKAHANACRTCAEFICFTQRLQGSLDIAIEPSPHVLDAIGKATEGGTQAQKRLATWLETIGGIPQMKKLAISAATLVVAAGLMFGIVARPAIAAEPKATFKKMKKAVLANKPKSKQDATWVVIDGKLTELEPGKAHTFSKGGVELTVGDKDGMMSDEVIKQIEQETGMTVEYLLSGQGDVRAFVDGKEVSAAETDKILRDLGIDLKISIDLDEAKYQDIRFGKDQNTLLLTPKGKADTRYSVVLDPKSSIPSKVTLERKKAGKWLPVKQSAVKLQPAKKVKV